jgi:uncharacterized damage-inducible protein DinB
MLGALLAEQVRLAHDGSAWHGPGLADNLEGLTAVEAAARPVPAAHSIWEIVLHAAGWADEVRRRLSGGEPAEPADGDWPEVGPVSEEAWAEARRRLRQVHQSLSEAIRQFPQSRWGDRVGSARDAPLGTGVTYADMIAGLLQHDAYHGGQIGLLRRALNPGATPLP